MTSKPSPSAATRLQITVTLFRADGAWHASVLRPDQPGARIFHSADDLATFLRSCWPVGLR
jgi:hypothetical protein